MIKESLKAKNIKKGTYENSRMWQQNSQSLVADVWSNNDGIVIKILSNYHQPIIVLSGLKRRKMIDSVRDKHAWEVNTPKQSVDYFKTFHQMYIGTQQEVSYYVLGEQGSRSYGWSPKLAFYFSNMNFNNAYMTTRYICYYMNANTNKIKRKVID